MLTRGRRRTGEEPRTPASSGAVARRVIHLASPEELPDLLSELDLPASCPVMVLVGATDGLGEAKLSRVRRLFEEGLAPLADSLGACVIDKGIDTGSWP